MYEAFEEEQQNLRKQFGLQLGNYIGAHMFQKPTLDIVLASGGSENLTLGLRGHT